MNQNLSENNTNKIDNLEKWRRLTKVIIKFFRFIKIPILRSRFIDMIKHFQFEELHNYETNKIQEDFRFLDDIKRYHEIFNTFSSFGFIWQDKEFQLAKLKANYIYDHYISTPEPTINIPMDIIPIISNRINSSKKFPSLTYFNLFNDAKTFIIEKLLLIYIREGLNCFGISSQKQTLSVNNRITNEHLKEISNHSNIKLKDAVNTDRSQYDEILIPNWTYSTELGVFYNPIREKRIKVITKNIRIKQINSNDMKLSESKSVISIPLKNIQPLSKSYSHMNRPKTNQTSIYHQCDTAFHNSMFNKRKVFICKTHSRLSSGSYRPTIKNEVLYRMTAEPQSSKIPRKIIISSND